MICIISMLRMLRIIRTIGIRLPIHQSSFYLLVFWTPTLCLVGGDEDVGGDEECSVLSGRNHIVSFVPHPVEPVEKFRSKYTWF